MDTQSGRRHPHPAGNYPFPDDAQGRRRVVLGSTVASRTRWTVCTPYIRLHVETHSFLHSFTHSLPSQPLSHTSTRHSYASLTYTTHTPVTFITRTSLVYVTHLHHSHIKHSSLADLIHTPVTHFSSSHTSLTRHIRHTHTRQHSAVYVETKTRGRHHTIRHTLRSTNTRTR